MNIFTRVKNILLSPIREWEVIDGESTSIGGLYINYAAPLALIPIVIGLLTSSLIEVSIPGAPIRETILAELPEMVIDYILGLTMLFVTALIVNALVPKFDGQPNLAQALKVVVYSMTALWVIPLFMIVPILGIYATQMEIAWTLMMAGIALSALIYWLVLLWRGLPRLMKVPEEKKIAFNTVVFLCLIVISIVEYFVIVIVR